VDYFDMVGQNVKRVLAAVEREGEECVLPDHLANDKHSQAAQRFRDEFAKTSMEIDRQAREAIGALITGVLCDIHIIATSLAPKRELFDPDKRVTTQFNDDDGPR
jgi:hypothetical protein